jgi:methionyl-tRNA formyltransferase
MRIVFLSGGARSKALRYLIEKGENVIAVITPLKTSQNNRFEEVIKTAEEFGLKVFSVKRNELYDVLKTLDYEIMISCGFSYIIERDSIATAKIAVNVHPTLLPAYRGYRSGPYIILNDETETGVTVHLLTVEMDKGDILAQESFPVTKFDTTKSLFRKCQEIEPRLLHKVIQDIKDGRLEPRPQDESKASTYNYIRTPKDSEIDPSKPLAELYNEIRACDPEDYPAYFFVDGQKVCVKMWRHEKPDNEQDMI